MGPEVPSEEEVTRLLKNLDTSPKDGGTGPPSQEPCEEDDRRLFEEINAYPWDSDTEFQGGLAAILGPKSDVSPSQNQDLTLRARLFYYARKKKIPPINFNAYKAYMSGPKPTPAEQNPSYPTPFAEIVALITSGKPIPGIKEIPPTVLPEKATKPLASRRRKPWEKGEDTEEVQKTFWDRRDKLIDQEALEAESSGITKPEMGNQ